MPYVKSGRSYGSSARPPIFRSREPLVERKSVFVAHVAPVRSWDDIELVKETLFLDRKVQRATHNVSAWRYRCETGAIRQHSNDDGETAAGARLLQMLQLAGAVNVFVMVSRWYGGVRLGSMRFRCINNCARTVLADHGFLKRS
ncbi:hypothetical protein HDV03_003932 [Kappamyces sp. JEL0829]|nr:hypothetical protein HDV03_003932 [Kappamyces sp. JEL0829]